MSDAEPTVTMPPMLGFTIGGAVMGMRRALNAKCAFYREGSLVSTKKPVLPAQIAYIFDPAFKPPIKGTSVTQGTSQMGIGNYYEQEKYQKLANSGAFPAHEKYCREGAKNSILGLTRAARNTLGIGVASVLGYAWMYRYRVVDQEILLEECLKS
jgi:hypothetical protein